MYLDERITSSTSSKYPLIRVPDPKLKDENYYRANSKALYYEYYNGLGAIGYSQAQEFSINRLFAAGNQSEDFYKNYLGGDSADQEAIIDPNIGFVGNKKTPSGYLRVFWDIVSPAQKIVNSVVDKCVSVSTDIIADPIDAISKEEIADAKLDLWFEKDFGEFKKQYFSGLGVDVEQPDYLPESKDELDLYEALGGFKPIFAKAMEKLIKYTEDISGMDVLTDMLYRDAIACGVMALWDDYDPETGLIKTEYVDPETAGIQWSLYPDCRDSEYAFRIKHYNISTLKQYFPDKGQDFWDKIALTFCGYSSNPVSGNFDKYNKATSYGGWGYDFFKIPVQESRWIDNDGTQKIYSTNKFGRETVSKVDYDFQPKKLDGKHQQFTLKRKCYQCKWIIGTDEIFQWGERTNQTFPSPKDAELGVHFYIFPGKSMIKQLIPIFHNFQVLWIRYLNALAQAINSGYEINVDTISNIQTGKDGDKNDKDLWTRRFIDTGIAFVSKITPTGAKENDVAIRELRGGMGQMFADIMVAFRFNLSLVESITGINPVALGETPNPNAPVATTKMALVSVSNILKYLVDGFLTVKKNMGSTVTRSIQVTLTHNKKAREAYRSVLSPMEMEVMTEARRASTEYAIELQARPNDAEKQMFIEQLRASMQSDRDGKTGGITGIDAVILIRRIEAGIPMSQVEFEMESRRRRNIREADKRSREMMEAQAKLNDQNAMLASKLQNEASDKSHNQKMEQLRQEGKNAIAKTTAQEVLKHGSAVDLASVTQEQPQPASEQVIQPGE